YLAQQRASGGSRAATLRTLVSAFAPRWLTSAYRRRRPVGPMPSWIDARRLARRDRAQAAAPRERWKRAQLGFLGGPQPSMDDYEKLAERLAAGDLPMSEFMWAKDLATAHAFLAQWCS